MSSPTLRQRFNLLRKTMAWSWKDIDRITDRQQSGSNISKGVPNWARLAIETNERYQALLQLHLIDAVRLRLGFEWTLVRRSESVYEFVPPHPVGAVVRLAFSPGELLLSGNTDNFDQLCRQLRLLYPTTHQATIRGGFQQLVFNLVPPLKDTKLASDYLAEHALPL